MMKVIIGLGNPGFRYRSTRHNIGFMAVDLVASRSGIRVRKRLFDSLCGRGAIDGEEVLLVKPLTYMNLSGKAVYQMVKQEGCSLSDILIVMDDADLELGKIRLRPKGSAGGHNGLRSIIEELGTEELPRLRIGIGAADRSNGLRDHVLSPFMRAERDKVRESIESSAACVEEWVNEGIDAAMARFNPTSPSSR